MTNKMKPHGHQPPGTTLPQRYHDERQADNERGSRRNGDCPA